MKRIRFINTILFSTLLAVSLIKCGGMEGGLEDYDPFTGLFSLGITDAPLAEINKAIVQFNGIEIQAASGERLTFDFETPRQIDLLALSGGGSEFLLSDQTLPAGHYNWIRLKVEAESDILDSYIELKDGSTRSLKIPSANQTGLKLVRGFEVPLGGITDLTIDFDLRKSIHNPSDLTGDYILRPTLRMVDNAEVGKIKGVIDPVLIKNPDNPACTVYIFEGLEVTPDDIDGLGAEPVTTAVVELDVDTGQYIYRAAFLNAGEYTVALTYMAADDDPEIDDDIEFDKIAQLTVSAGPATNYDFQAQRSISFVAGYRGPNQV